MNKNQSKNDESFELCANPIIKTKIKKPLNNYQKYKYDKMVKQTKMDKEKYFSFYNDIKHHSRGQEDW